MSLKSSQTPTREKNKNSICDNRMPQMFVAKMANNAMYSCLMLIPPK